LFLLAKSGMTEVVHGTNLCKVYNYHDNRAYGYKQSGILSRLDGFGCGMVWFDLVWFWFSLYGVV
jgi:hypothetical protein